MSARRVIEVVIPIEGDPLRRVTRLLEPNHAARIVHRHTSIPKKRSIEEWDMARKARQAAGNVLHRELGFDYAHWIDEQDVYRKISHYAPLTCGYQAPKKTGVRAHIDVDYEHGCAIGVLLNGVEYEGRRCVLTPEEAQQLLDELPVLIEAAKTHGYSPKKKEFLPIVLAVEPKAPT